MPCAYGLCDRQVSPDKAYTAELIYMHGTMMRKKKLKYCSEI
ncbi:YdaE family protein, partial [Shigella flexneri]